MKSLFSFSTMLPAFLDVDAVVLSLFLTSSSSTPTTTIYNNNSLLEEEEELTADAVRALCSPLSGEELLHAADERTLAGKCGWAACCFSSEGFELLDPARSRRIASRGPRRRLPALAGMQGRDERFCGAECELACLRLASRLGAEADALRRFEEKRSASSSSSSSSSGASTEGAAAVAPVPRQLQQQQKTKREFAAGTAESPIMRSVVVERKKAAARGGVAAVAAPSSSPPLLSDPIAVDGYVPRGAAGVVRAAAAADAVANNMSQSPLSSSPGGGGGCSTPRGSLRRTVSWREEAHEARSLSRLGSSVVRRRVEAEDLSRARAIAAGDDGSNSSDDERLPTTTTDGENNSNDAPRPSVPGVTAGIPIISFEMEEEEEKEEENEGQRHGGGGEEVARFGRLKISAAGEGADAAAAAFPSATSRDGAAAAPNDLSLSSSDPEDNGNDGDLSPRSAAAAVAAALPLPLPELIARAQQRRRNNGGGGDSGSSSIPASALLDEARERQLVADFVTWRARLDADDDEGAEAVTPMVMADAAPPSLTAAAPSSPRQQQQQRPFEPASPGTPDRSGGGPLAVGVALAPRGGTPCSSDDEGEEGEGCGGNGVLIDVDDNEEEDLFDQQEDNVAGPAAWLSAPPPGSTRLAPPLSPFGVLLAALDSLVTPETRAMLSSSDSSSSAASFAAATSAAALPLPKTISAPLSRALPLLVAEMRLALPASTVEALLAEVARSFDLSGAAWNDGEEGNSDEGKSKNSSPLSDPQWQVILLVLLKALSLERVPALRPAFEERQGITRLSASLRRLGCTLEAFGALLDIVVVADD